MQSAPIDGNGSGTADCLLECADEIRRSYVTLAFSSRPEPTSVDLAIPCEAAGPFARSLSQRTRSNQVSQERDLE